MNEIKDEHLENLPSLYLTSQTSRLQPYTYFCYTTQSTSTMRKACELLMQYDLVFGILKCTLPEDTIHVDLKACTPRGIYTFRKDRRTQIMKWSPWGTEIQPYPSLKKMVEFMRHRQTIATPLAIRSFQPRPKVVAKKCNLVPLTRQNRENFPNPEK